MCKHVLEIYILKILCSYLIFVSYLANHIFYTKIYFTLLVTILEHFLVSGKTPHWIFGSQNSICCLSHINLFLDDIFLTLASNIYLTYDNFLIMFTLLLTNNVFFTIGYLDYKEFEEYVLVFPLWHVCKGPSWRSLMAKKILCNKTVSTRVSKFEHFHIPITIASSLLVEQLLK